MTSRFNRTANREIAPARPRHFSFSGLCHTRHSAGLLAALLAGLHLATPARAADPATPVTIGRDGPDLDACGAIGRVERLGAPPFDKLTVRERPEATAAPKGRLARDTMVWLCDGQGEWQGIVYPTGAIQELGDCRVGSPVPEPTAYDGPCGHGWVLSRNIELVAG